MFALPHSSLNANFLPVIDPGAIKDNAAFTSNVIDLASEAVRGAAALVFAFHVGDIDVAMAVCKVMESSSKTDATTLGGTPAEVVDVTDTVTPGASDDNKIYLVVIDLSADRKRYIQLQATAGNGTAGMYASAMCLAMIPSNLASSNNAAALINA